jgi:Cof subfamily protein (haloacid dehalogenase superfamily)
MEFGGNGQPAGLLAVDVDGTLITDHGEITEKVYQALEKASAAGWETVIATGRTLYAARRIIGSLPFVKYALLSNGSCIVNVRESNIMHLEKIPSPVVGEVVEVVRRNGAVPVLYDADIYDQKLFYDTTEGACDFFVWYVNNDKRSARVPDVLAHAGNVQQIGSIAARETIFRIREEIALLPAVPMTLPFESPHFGGKNHDFWFLQVVPAGMSKSVAIRKIAEWLRVPSGRIVAVGDNYNDVDMIQGADVGVAMGNAPDEIKRLARVVVGTNNDSGLADVVERVIVSGEFFDAS